MNPGGYPDPNEGPRPYYSAPPQPPAPAAPPKRNTRLWLIAAAVVAVVAVGIVIVVVANNGDSTRSLSAFCSEQRSFRSGLSHRAFDGVNPPSAAEYADVAAELRKLAGQVPSTPISHDLTVLADGADQASRTGSGFLDSQQVLAASRRVGAYVTHNCQNS